MIDTDTFRSHCQDWLGVNDYGVEQCMAIADELDAMRMLAEGQERLMVCYRTGTQRGSDAALTMISKARAALAAQGESR